MNHALTRALAIGTRLRELHSDPNMHNLSRAGWRAATLALGGFATTADLEACRDRIQRTKFLSREVLLRAQIWADAGLDRPACWPGFADGDRFTAAFAEMLAAGLGAEQVSAVASMHCADLRSEFSFGKLSTFAEFDAAVAPLRTELAELDARLADELLLTDLDWTMGTPRLVVGTVAVPLTRDTATCAATAVAEAVCLAQSGIREAA